MGYHVLLTYDVKRGKHQSIREYFEDEEGWTYLELTTSFSIHWDDAHSRSSAMRLTRESIKRTMDECDSKIEAAFLVSSDGDLVQDIFS